MLRTEETWDYQPNSPNGTGESTHKVVSYDYDNIFADVTRITETFSDAPEFNKVTTMEYGDYNQYKYRPLTIKTDQKDAETTVIEKYYLHGSRNRLVVGAKEVFEQKNGHSTKKERVNYEFEDGDNPYCVTLERRHYADAGDTYHSTRYYYRGSEYTHEPYAVRVPNVLGPTGAAYPGN